MTRLGVPLRIDRTNRRVEYLPYPLPPADVEAPPPFHASILGAIPPPLTECLFTDDGRYCLGPLVAPELVLHEDFLHVPTTTSAGAIACDTGWRIVTLTAGGAVQQVSAGIGAALLTTATTLNAVTHLNKDENVILPPSAPAGLWYSSRVTSATATTARAFVTGFSDQGFQDLAYWRFTSAEGLWSLQTGAAGSYTIDTTSVGDAPTAGAWDDLDVLLVGGEFAAFWLNGTGPHVIYTNVPTAATGIIAFIQNLTAGTARSWALEYVTVRHLPVVLDPRRLPI